MEEETQKELLKLAKLAMVAISGGRRDEELLYALRDIIHKLEGKDGRDS